MSPQLYICGGCGYVLDELQIRYTLEKPMAASSCTTIYESMKSPDQILQKHGGRCPNCGKKLVFKPENVKVTAPP